METFVPAVDVGAADSSWEAGSFLMESLATSCQVHVRSTFIPERHFLTVLNQHRGRRRWAAAPARGRLSKRIT